MQVSETMAASSHQQQNGQVIGLGSIGTLENDPDTKLFVVKKTGDSQGITALISRQLQEERMPLLYMSQEVLHNALHHTSNHLCAPYTRPLNPVQCNVQSSL